MSCYRVNQLRPVSVPSDTFQFRLSVVVLRNFGIVECLFGANLFKTEFGHPEPTTEGIDEPKNSSKSTRIWCRAPNRKESSTIWRVWFQKVGQSSRIWRVVSRTQGIVAIWALGVQQNQSQDGARGAGNRRYGMAFVTPCRGAI